MIEISAKILRSLTPEEWNAVSEQMFSCAKTSVDHTRQCYTNAILATSRSSSASIPITAVIVIPTRIMLGMGLGSMLIGGMIRLLF